MALPFYVVNYHSSLLSARNVTDTSALDGNILHTDIIQTMTNEECEGYSNRTRQQEPGEFFNDSK